MPNSLNANTSAMRLPLARAGLSRVDREVRRIEGVAVITRGEALGHELWIDGAFLDAVVAAGNANPKGLKSLWTHPSMFEDGLGTYLGRISSLYRDGDVVRGDFQLSESVKYSPKGDLGAYILSLAEEDPEAFGLSIVFDRDVEAETSFSNSNLDESGNFVSPDENNKYNLAHARLSTLYGADVVSEPAANPKGIFATIAEYLSRCGPFSFIIGDKMEDKNNLETAPEAPQAPEGLEEEAPQEEKPEEQAAEMCPECGQPMPEAPAEESAEAEEEKPEDEMSERVGAIEAGLAELKNMVAELAKPKPAGTRPVGFGGEPTAKDFRTLAKEYAEENKCDLAKAMSVIAQKYPDVHRRYIGR